MQSVPQVYSHWKVFQCRHGEIDWSAGLVGQRAENVLKWFIICRCNYTCTPAFVFLYRFVFVFRLHFYLNDTLEEVCVESLGGLDGHRDQKMFHSIQFVLGLVCVFGCFTLFVFSIVSVFAEHAFGGLGGLSGRTGEKCLKVMNLDCTITVA